VLVLDAVVVPVVPEVDVAVVPVVVVEVVAVVADVSVAVPEGIAEVAVLSVVDIVPAVEAVSVLLVVEALTPVSVAAVSVEAFSSFLQPTAKMATANRATRVTMRDFFIFSISFNLSGSSEPDAKCRCERETMRSFLWVPESPLFAKPGAPKRAIPLIGV
jgi:hypothetical protein